MIKDAKFRLKCTWKVKENVTKLFN